jgi:hypothetical protein
MLNAYYKLWVDAIVFEKTKRNSEVNWKAYSLVPVSLLMGINLLTLLYWTNELTHHHLPVLLIVGIFNNRLIDIFISVIVMYFIPFFLLNYLVIFYDRRYEKLVKVYKNTNGKLYRKYTLISLGLLAVPLILKWVF